MILDYIRGSGRISRVELARMSGLTQAAISNIVRRTIADGLVVETGFSESTGGKRRTLLDINSASRYAVGLSLEYQRMSFVVTDLSGHLVGRLITDGTRDVAPATVIERIGDQVEQLIVNLRVDPAAVVGIGVASPGPLDSWAGVLRGEQPTPQWAGVAIEEQLAARTGRTVALDNDATCAALGEYWTSRHGSPRSVSATVYMADGIGCGILMDGRVFHGTSSNAGELGHITLDIDGPECRCGARGCVEVYASPAAVLARARQQPELVEQLGLEPVGGHPRAGFSRIVKAAARGHQPSLELIVVAAARLGVGIVTLSNILDLDEVYLSGPGFGDVGALYARVIQDQLDHGTYMRAIHPVQVKISHIGTEAAALGAAALVLQRQITPYSATRSVRRSPVRSI